MKSSRKCSLNILRSISTCIQTSHSNINAHIFLPVNYVRIFPICVSFSGAVSHVLKMVPVASCQGSKYLSQLLISLTRHSHFPGDFRSSAGVKAACWKLEDRVGRLGGAVIQLCILQCHVGPEAAHLGPRLKKSIRHLI